MVFSDRFRGVVQTTNELAHALGTPYLLYLYLYFCILGCWVASTEELGRSVWAYCSVDVCGLWISVTARALVRRLTGLDIIFTR